MANPTVPELHEALCYLDRTVTIIKSMAIPQISLPRCQSLAMQNLFRDKLDHFCDRLILFLSIDKEFNQQVLLAWLDTILDIRKQMWDGSKGRAAYEVVNWGHVDVATGAIIKKLQAYQVDNSGDPGSS